MFKLERNISKQNLNKMIKEAARLKRLQADPNSGWYEFVRLLEDYSKAMLEYKKNFNLCSASDEDIERLKLYDRDIWLINNYIKKLPSMFINNLEEMLADKRREEEEQEVEKGLN